jgi:hypothetical protein
MESEDNEVRGESELGTTVIESKENSLRSGADTSKKSLLNLFSECTNTHLIQQERRPLSKVEK